MRIDSFDSRLTVRRSRISRRPLVSLYGDHSWVGSLRKYGMCFTDVSTIRATIENEIAVTLYFTPRYLTNVTLGNPKQPSRLERNIKLYQRTYLPPVEMYNYRRYNDATKIGIPDVINRNKAHPESGMFA